MPTTRSMTWYIDSTLQDLNRQTSQSDCFNLVWPKIELPEEVLNQGDFFPRIRQQLPDYELLVSASFQSNTDILALRSALGVDNTTAISFHYSHQPDVFPTQGTPQRRTQKVTVNQWHLSRIEETEQSETETPKVYTYRFRSKSWENHVDGSETAFEEVDFTGTNRKCIRRPLVYSSSTGLWAPGSEEHNFALSFV